MASPPMILKLDEIVSIARKTESENEHKYCHVYCIYIQDETTKNGTYWSLVDETHIEGVRIKLKGNLSDYPKLKPGDIVRIHRLSFDWILHEPYIVLPRNVVVWSAFEHNPTQISPAHRPTINRCDDEKRQELEKLYFNTLHRIETIQSHSRTQFFNLCGRVEALDIDPYENIRVTFEDGTGKITIRVFKPKELHDIKDHFEIARSLKKGEFIVVTNVKLNASGQLLDLSANNRFGKTIRKAEENSVLGGLLNERLGGHKTNKQQPLAPNNSNHDDNHNHHQSTVPGEETTTATTTTVTKRRSPRFLNSSSESSSQASSQTKLSPSKQTKTKESLLIESPSSRKKKRSERESPTVTTAQHLSNICSQDNERDACEDMIEQPLPPPPRPQTPFPECTKVSEIGTSIGGNRVKFFDIVGQVRGDPVRTQDDFKNWVFQLYDGSRPRFKNYWDKEIKQPVPDCVSILVYSVQDKERDSDVHVKVVEKLKEGDLVHIKNLRATWREGALKLEMSANTSNNKEVKVIPRETRFGLHLMDIVQNPHVEELSQNEVPADSDESLVINP